MPRKLAVKTRFDKEREKADVKLLVFAGYGVREAARQVGINEQTAINWSVEGSWMQELARIKQIANQGEPSKTTAEKVAFDLAKTNRQSRAALAQIANLTAMRKLESITESGGIIIDDASDFASFTKATAQIAGDWDDASANRFAVSLNINQLVQSGSITEIPPGSVIEIDE